jgi:hypothetical protein
MYLEQEAIRRKKKGKSIPQLAYAIKDWSSNKERELTVKQNNVFYYTLCASWYRGS